MRGRAPIQLRHWRGGGFVALLASFLLVGAALLSSVVHSPTAGEGASIWTDKPDYSPEEVVTITGSGFDVNVTVNVRVTRPDGGVDPWDVDSDDHGGFTTTYQLDGISGVYTVDATDGTNSATTTFTDSPCPASRPDTPISPSLVAFSISGSNPFTYSVVTSDQSPSGGVPGLSEVCVYRSGGTVSTATALYGSWTASDETTGDDRVEFVRDGGNPTNIPLNGDTVDVGEIEYSLEPSSEVIVAHLQWPSYCSPDNSCFRVLSEFEADTTTETVVHLEPGHTVVSSAIPLGSSVHDNATVSSDSGGPEITGTVTFNFWTNGDCDGAPDDSDAVSVGSESPSQGPLAAGAYSFNATYSGDDNYNPSFSECEPFTVSTANTMTTTVVHDDDHDDVTGIAVPLGTAVHDNATVGPTVDGFTITGTVTFNFWTNGACDDDPSSSGTVGVGAESTAQTLGAGMYSYNATYSGDANYGASFSDCEPFEIEQAGTTTTTEIHLDPGHSAATSVNLGDSVHDNATVGPTVDGFTITGTVTYGFSTNGCDGPFAFFDSEPVGAESISTAALAAGFYAFQATYSGDSNYEGSTSDCEPLTVNKAATGTTTEIHLDPGHSAVTSVNLGDSVHDNATVGPQVDGFAIGGTVTYNFWLNRNCDGTPNDSDTVSVGSESPPQGPLGAGYYSYNATYSGDDNYDPSFSDCEPLTVNKADSTIVTEIHSHTHSVITVVVAGAPVHDNATVSGQVDGFAITGTVTYNFWTNADCSGTPAASEPVGVGAESTPQTLAAGSYSYNATYSGNANYNASFSNCEPLRVVPPSQVTDTMFCDFGGDFNLIYVQNSTGSTFRLVASNPGQFYDNVFFSGASGDFVSLDIEIPFPFVTHGAKPIQVHSSVGSTTIGEQTCFQLTDDITSDFSVTVAPRGGTTPSGNPSILLSSYTPQNLGSQVTVSVAGSMPTTGFLWVTIHIEYGLKDLDFTKITTTSSSCPTPPCAAITIDSQSITVENPQLYTFGVMGSLTDTQLVSSHNTFKHDPGIVGVVTDPLGAPRFNVEVRIYDSENNLEATVYTDTDGFYSYLFKYTGTPTTFTINLPAFGVQKTVTIISNQLVTVDFAV